MSGIKGKAGWLVFAFLAVMPIVLWFLMKPAASRFESFPVIMSSIGQLSALLGMSIFSLNLVLGARFKFLESYFNGLDRMYVKHHVMGGIAFVLLMLHPMALAVRYVPSSLRLAALFLLPDIGLEKNLGIIALWSMMLLLVITFFIKIPYQKWKLTHKFLGAAFLFGGMHMFFVSSDVSANLLLRYYMFALAGLAGISILYRTVLGRKLVKKLEYVAEDVRQLNKDVVEIVLKPKNKPMKFLSGQFAFISFHCQGISSEVHPFSIASAPSEGGLRINVKILGDYTAKLKDLKKGCAAKIEGPFGRFCHQLYGGKNQIWIAGGIGITPFLSMARCLKGSDYRVDLYYCTKNEEEAICLEELMKLSRENKNFRVIACYSEKEGRLTAQKVAETSGGLAGKVILICGPVPMMKSLREQFRKLGVPKKNIRTEEFALQ